jgi:DNA invertase Pin-like site-specific DNA recombinase
MEARFNAIGAGMYTFDAERIGERVRRSVERARRKAVKAQERASKRAEKYARKHDRKRSITIGGPEPSGPVVSEEERMSVLRMLEQGKISVEEAEKLLKTLGGEV